MSGLCLPPSPRAPISCERCAQSRHAPPPTVVPPELASHSPPPGLACALGAACPTVLGETRCCGQHRPAPSCPPLAGQAGASRWSCPRVLTPGGPRGKTRTPCCTHLPLRPRRPGLRRGRCPVVYAHSGSEHQGPLCMSTSARPDPGRQREGRGQGRPRPPGSCTVQACHGQEQQGHGVPSPLLPPPPSTEHLDFGPGQGMGTPSHRWDGQTRGGGRWAGRLSGPQTD